MSIQNNYVAIMAGGIGSRFWPESRNKHPKQFLDILGTGKSLIQWTFERFKNICPLENFYVITNEKYIETMKEQLPFLPVENIVAEPARKNTAPCTAYISHKIHNKNPDANIIMSPADHLIFDERKFERNMLDSLEYASQNDVLVTLGIKPTRPDTGYGYIQFDTNNGQDDFYQVKTFTEKPTIEIAETFLKSGDFLWNSGIFVWNAKTILAAFEEHLPELNDVFKQVSSYNTTEEKEEIAIAYPQCTNISIDYGIMEKALNVHVLQSFFGWSDLGTWNSAYENSKRDYLGNAVYGSDVMIIDASQCMVKAADDKLVVIQGLENFIVVDTDDVLLICNRENEQQIKEYVAEVKRHKGDKFL